MTKDNLHIPSHWKTAKLGEIGAIASGGTPSTKVKEYFNGDVAWITPADLTNYSNKYISRGKRNISKMGLQKSSAKLLQKGSVLFSSRAPIGYVVIAANEISTNQGFKNLIPAEYVFNEFVYYYLKSAKRLAEGLASGTTFKEISAKNFAKIPIPLPPLPEQHRIVAKIEELFSELDNAVENLKKAKAQLKTYRQAVLKNAFEGRLFNSISKWTEDSLKNICFKVQDGSHFSPQKQFNSQEEGLYPYITSKNIRNNYLDLDQISYVEEDFHQSIYNRCNPEYGDILLTKDGVNTGNVTINTIKEPFSLLSSVCLIKPNKKLITSEYIKYYIQSPQGFKNITGQMTGTAIKRIILKRIKEAIIRFPIPDEQYQIVQEIETRFSVADKLEQSIDQSLQQAEALRQSILKRAFEGKLLK